MKNPFATRKFKDTDVVLALESFTGALDNGREIRVTKDSRLRGSSEIVKKWPEFFAPEGADSDELQQQREAVFYRPSNEEAERADRSRREEEARRSPPQPPLAEAAQVIQAFAADGRSYGTGELVRLDDPIVKKYPERFQLPARPLPR